jgi:3-dehydroquinate synthase
VTAIWAKAGAERYAVRVEKFDVAAVQAIDASGVMLISDENVWNAHGSEFRGLGPCCIVPPGEKSKCVAQWERCLEWLAGQGADRRSLVLAVGGGVVGDLAGFVAATYMRGIRWANVATSLLAQLDAAIGGKTGIDTAHGKNLVGAFHQPVAVWCNPEHLRSLPERHFRAAMAEAIKYGVALDAGFLNWQEEVRGRLTVGSPQLTRLIKTCVRLKTRIVAQDPMERSGRRALLNFGHTVGHALETALGYDELLHGEAVMVGMIAESEIAAQLGLGPKELPSRLRDLADSWELPHKIASARLISPMMEAMTRDKKGTGKRIAMTLPTEVGSCVLVPDVDAEAVQRVLRGI